MVDELLVYAAAFLVILLIVLLALRLLRRTFNPIELFLIILCPILSVIEISTSIELFAIQNTVFGIDIAGAAIPLLVSASLFIRSIGKIRFIDFIGATIVVALSAYSVTELTAAGIISPFPIYLVPPLIATIVALMASPRLFAGRLAYFSSVLGVLIGADLIRLREIADSGIVEKVVIGGARVGDMIFISGIIAVVMSSILVPFGKREREDVEVEER